MALAWGRRFAILAIFVAAVAVLAPASLVETPLAARTQNRLRLSESAGFWWKGRGTLALADGSARLPVVSATMSVRRVTSTSTLPPE